MLPAVAAVSTISIALCAILVNHFIPPKACDLTNVLNRDFNHYYGLNELDNPLTNLNAEQGASISSKCGLFYDHMKLFSADNLPLSATMIIRSLRGSGKTQVRQCIINRISRSNRILIKVYGADVESYLKAFVANIDDAHGTSQDKIIKYWTKEHFLQIILNEIALRFADSKFISILERKVNKISLQIRKEVAILLSFYSTKDSAELCKVVNLLLHEITKCSILNCEISCFDYINNDEDKQRSLAIEHRHSKVIVTGRTLATDACLRLLVAIEKKTKSSPLPLLDRSYRDQVSILVNFLSMLEITTTVIIDSLDENEFFFNKKDPHLQTLQTFINSTTNDEILYLALGNWGANVEVANSFEFYIFIPKSPSTTMTIPWTHIDKIPIRDLIWNESQLKNYADYMFNYLRSKSHNQCKPLPDICTLLGGQNLCLDTMKQLRHPRDFHIFYEVLTQQMSAVCTQRNQSFIATKKDLGVVLAETKERVRKE